MNELTNTVNGEYQIPDLTISRTSQVTLGKYGQDAQSVSTSEHRTITVQQPASERAS